MIGIMIDHGRYVRINADELARRYSLIDKMNWKVKTGGVPDCDCARKAASKMIDIIREEGMGDSIEQIEKEFVLSKESFANISDGLYKEIGCTQPVTKKFIEVVIKMIALFDLKQRRYGTGNIATFGDAGVLIRSNDKMARLVNLFKTKEEPKDETKDDTWLDLAVYCVIALMCRWKLWPDT